MQNTGLDEAQAGIRIAGRNISNLRYSGVTTLLSVKRREPVAEGEKAGLKLNIKKLRSQHLVPSLHGRVYFFGLQNQCRQ